jgi:hypothetical protein
VPTPLYLLSHGLIHSSDASRSRAGLAAG